MSGERHKFTHRNALTLHDGSNNDRSVPSDTPPHRPPGFRREGGPGGRERGFLAISAKESKNSAKQPEQILLQGSPSLNDFIELDSTSKYSLL
jgi:hypothetical protein